MAHLVQGILGGFSGTAGTVIGFIKNGKSYIRGKVTGYNDPQTESQKAIRNRFKACIQFAGLIKKELIKPIWDKLAKEMSGINLFVKQNFASFDKDGNIANYAALTLSMGELPLPGNIEVSNHASGNGSLLISWDDNSGFDIAMSTDQLKVVAVKGNQPVVITGQLAQRSDAEATIHVPFVAGDQVHVYLFFQDEAALVYSPSAHAMVTIPNN